MIEELIILTKIIFITLILTADNAVIIGSIAANFVPKPVTVIGTFSGKFSDRSYDVSWSIQPATSAEDVVEMKRWENENSERWQKVRHFIGAAFVSWADWLVRLGREQCQVALVWTECG